MVKYIVAVFTNSISVHSVSESFLPSCHYRKSRRYYTLPWLEPVAVWNILVFSMDSFFPLITWFGSLYVLMPLTILIGVCLINQHRLIEMTLLLGGLFGTSVVTHFLKIVFARPRPPVTELIVSMPTDFSFPSAHTSQITAFVCVLALIFYRQLSTQNAILLLLALFVLAILVGASRVYLKVHYLSDVLAGAALGAGWVLILWWLLRLSTNRGE